MEGYTQAVLAHLFLNAQSRQRSEVQNRIVNPISAECKSPKDKLIQFTYCLQSPSVNDFIHCATIHSSFTTVLLRSAVFWNLLKRKSTENHVISVLCGILPFSCCDPGENNKYE